VIGDGASPIFFPFFLEEPLTTCGDDELACAALVTLVPDSDTDTGARLTALQLSSQPVALTPEPLVVDGTFSGHWFNKVPGGEGVIVQVISDGRVLAYWVTYDDVGAQRWILGIGRREGLRVEFEDLYVSENGVFSAESPVLFDAERIGEMEIEFFDCNNGEVRSRVDGVPRTMEIGRLTGLSSLECIR